MKFEIGDRVTTRNDPTQWGGAKGIVTSVRIVDNGRLLVGLQMTEPGRSALGEIGQVGQRYLVWGDQFVDVEHESRPHMQWPRRAAKTLRLP